MKKYDLHNHTHYSKCSTLHPKRLLQLAKKNNFDGIAITDHHNIKGAVMARQLNKDKDFEVIVGEEITTQYGDVLCLYIEKNIRSRDLFEVLDETKKQNGIVIIPHPFRSKYLPFLKFKYPIHKLKNKIAGIECLNARMLPGGNSVAQIYAKKHGIAGTGGSDAHFEFDCARAYTLFDGDLISALKQKKTYYEGNITFGPIGGFISATRNILPLKVKE